MRRGVRQVASGGRRLVDVLAAAFADDPWLAWTLPDAGARRSLLSLFLRTVGFEAGEVRVVEDPVQGVAVLMPPDVQVPEQPEVGEVVLALHGRMAGRALDADAVVQRFRRTDPGWVLHTLGVDPTAQGQGLGAALLAACLHRVGSEELTLETSSAASRDWYLRRGFTLDEEVVLADHGLGRDAPTIWLLSRSRG